jgi:hypothetical protein
MDHLLNSLPYVPRHLRRPFPQRHARAILAGALLTPIAAGTMLLGQIHAPTQPRVTETVAAAANPPQQAALPAPAAPAPAVTVPVLSMKMLDYDFQWQPNFYYCGPAAARIAMTVRGLFPTQDTLATALGTTVNGTNSAADITRVLNGLGNTGVFKSRFIRGSSATPAELEQLKVDVLNTVGSGLPIVANIAGTATDSYGRTHSFPGGHYITVVGYSDSGDTVKIADSADTYGRGWYLISTRNLAHWIATRGYSA